MLVFGKASDSLDVPLPAHQGLMHTVKYKRELGVNTRREGMIS